MYPGNDHLAAHILVLNYHCTMVKGNLVDSETRCVHYQSKRDIIAIKFKCCKDYYPCYECHAELAGHKPEVWTKQERNEKAILCGLCKTELTIREYLDSSDICPRCGSSFNPNCNRHFHLYFEV